MKQPIVVIEDNKIVGYNKLAKTRVKRAGHDIIKGRKSPIYALR